MSKMNDAEAIAIDSISDQEVIARILKGEKELYALVVRRYNQRLYRIGISMICNEVEVEDAMQVAYIKAYEHLKNFEFKSSFATWLTRILINECLFRIKSAKRSVALCEEKMDISSPRQLIDNQTPFKKVMNSELKEILEGAIKKLPEKYRTVFVMREIENLNIAETKECLNLSEVNVKVRLNRAKALLQSELKAYYNNEDLFNYHKIRCDRMVDNVMKIIENP
jgi:RNA polymerase sigma-70 factor (ECF subfamily)